ncbi:uncharacterized protein LY89DRAFT_789283 [Mollisia scopiformis]|uniref:Myb/SANT-like domain-containing protein n=1 Tax=Mollisia scopiformis TaxID=149040 RepID=A0A132B6J1_MOLSC|nr:uncharacterized protein LY89DRAFT_789283 [Mollisia scopiformis]KUJ08028.1 hypothetical protein LY89DRAFT_789283 [Mollisia scopiformis]
MPIVTPPKAQSASPSSASSYTTAEVSQIVTWNYNDITFLILHLKELKAEGKSIEVGFEPEPWRSIAMTFEDPLKDEQSCQRMWLKLKKEYHEFKCFVGMPGFRLNKDDLPVAAPEVWEEFEKKYPERIKWRTTRFPWMYSILQIIEDFGVEPEKTLVERKSKFHARFLEGSGDSESPAVQKRHIETTPPPPYRPMKKQKTKSLDATDDDLRALAEDLSKSSPSTIPKMAPKAVPERKEDIAIIMKTLHRVQEETCLTDDGVLFMLDILGAQAPMARKYMAFRKDSTRVAWLRQQLKNSKEDLSDLFIEQD